MTTQQKIALVRGASRGIRRAIAEHSLRAAGVAEPRKLIHLGEPADVWSLIQET